MELRNAGRSSGVRVAIRRRAHKVVNRAETDSVSPVTSDSEEADRVSVRSEHSSSGRSSIVLRESSVDSTISEPSSVRSFGSRSSWSSTATRGRSVEPLSSGSSSSSDTMGAWWSEQPEEERADERVARAAEELEEARAEQLRTLSQRARGHGVAGLRRRQRRLERWRNITASVMGFCCGLTDCGWGQRLAVLLLVVLAGVGGLLGGKFAYAVLFSSVAHFHGCDQYIRKTEMTLVNIFQVIPSPLTVRRPAAVVPRRWLQSCRSRPVSPQPRPGRKERTAYRPWSRWRIEK